MPFTMYRFFVYRHFQTRTRTKYITPEARFRAESVDTSPVIIGRELAKLFEFLQLHSQRERTIIPFVQVCLRK